MAISFGQVFLHSFAPDKLFNFLSFVLDVEATEFESEVEVIRFNFHGIDFVILPSEKKRLSRTKYFSLSVDSEKELCDLKDNIEFFHYKQLESKFTLKLEDETLEFSDPDGRIWQVEVRTRDFASNPSVKTNHFSTNQM